MVLMIQSGSDMAPEAAVRNIPSLQSRDLSNTSDLDDVFRAQQVADRLRRDPVTAPGRRAVHVLRHCDSQTAQGTKKSIREGNRRISRLGSALLGRQPTAA